MHDTLQLVLVLLLGAVLMVAVFRRLGLPPMLGYLLLGILVGPHALALVAEGAATSELAEFGVVFLMFSIGLEFSLPQLLSMRRLVVGFGGAQVVLTMVAILLIALVTGLQWRAGFALGAVLAMSSTAIVSKTLAERLELHSAHGRQIMGAALFQDLAVVPLLILVPALGPHAGGALLPLVGSALLKAALALALLLGVGRRVMGAWFHRVAAQKSSEIFVLNVLLVTLGLAWVTAVAGLSLALGAFLAGMLISETEYRYQVEDAIKPFRDVLLGLFFISIGMLLDLGAVVSDLGWVALMLVALLAVKVALVMGIGRAFGNSPAIAMRTALALAPAGEFGFVLLAQAGAVDLLAPRLMQITLAAALLSMLLAPVILLYSDRLVLYWFESEWMNRAMALTQLSVRTMSTQGHVIVCGYGRSGQNLARSLEQEDIEIVALDLDPQRVRTAGAAGDSVVYGDATRRDVLISAGVHRASAVVVSFSDAEQALKILAHVHSLEPGLPVIVRTLDDTDMDRLRDAGAAEVVPEVLEGALMLASHAMLLLGVPLNRVLRRIREVRRQRYQLMRGFFPGSSDLEEEDQEHAQPRLQSVLLTDSAHACGRTLADLDLPALGVEVTAVRRRNIRAIEPAPETVLQTADVLVLLGTPENLGRGEMRLLHG